MKRAIMVCGLLAALSTAGFDCFNSGFLVAINLDPFNGCYYVNSGSNPNYAGSTTIDSKTLYDQSYELTGVAVYDIRVQTHGSDLGTVANGTVLLSVGGGPAVTLATYSGSWGDFLTPVSILTRPDLVQADTNGIHALTLAIQDKQIVELKSTGTVQRIPPTSTESQVCVWAYAQAYGKLP